MWVRDIAQFVANKAAEFLRDNGDQDIVLFAATRDSCSKIIAIPSYETGMCNQCAECRFQEIS